MMKGINGAWYRLWPEKTIEAGSMGLVAKYTGLEFSECYSRREQGTLGAVAVAFLSREDLIRNKRAVGRPRDLADAAELEGD